MGEERVKELYVYNIFLGQIISVYIHSHGSVLSSYSYSYGIIFNLMAS